MAPIPDSRLVHRWERDRRVWLALLGAALFAGGLAFIVFG